MRSTARIWLVRSGPIATAAQASAHSESAQRFVGRRDAPLSAAGLQRAHEIADLLAARPLVGVLATRLERARAMAGPLVARTGLALELANDLEPLDMGDWQDRDPGTIAESEALARWLAYEPEAAPSGGETWAALFARVERALSRVAERAAGGEVAVFVHGTVLRAALATTFALGPRGMAGTEPAPGALAGLDLPTQQDQESRPTVAGLDLDWTPPVASGGRERFPGGPTVASS